MMSPMKEWRDVMLALFSESSLFSAPSNLTDATKSATGVDNRRWLVACRVIPALDGNVATTTDPCCRKVGSL